MRFRYLSPLILVVVASLPLSGATPQVAGVSPASGPVGSQVQINGSGFGASQGTSTAAFGYRSNGTLAYANAAIVSWSDSQVVAVVPSTTNVGPVKVTVGGVDSNTNMYFSVPPPQVSSITPASGVSGTQVTVTGAGFQAVQGGSTLSFITGGIYHNATASSWSDTQIVAVVPSGALTGPVQVTVNGVGSNLDVLFTMPNPIVTSVSPSSGPVGTQVQVNGSGFGATQGTSTLKINGQTATVATWSDAQIVATVSSVTTTGPVSVTVAGISSNSGIYFTVPPPHVSSLSPATGVAGTQVAVSGSGFQASQGSSSISFNSHTPTVTGWSDTQIVASIPSSTSTGPVWITVNGVISNQDVVLTTPNPVITNLSPSSGPGGTQVQVNGAGFGATQGSSTITVGVYPATVVSWSNNQIVATASSYALTGAAQVTVSGVVSNSDIVFTVSPAQIASISPTSGTVGTQVTINGSNFQSTRPTYGNVFFNGVNATVTSWSSSQIVATVPSGAATGPVTVTANSNGASLTSNENMIFTMPQPAVASVAPTSGPGGTQVQINGSGFGATQGSSTIAFNGVNAAVTTWSDTQITATVPPSASSGPVRVNEGGVASNGNVTFTVAPPQITGISPTSGSVGTQVTISGANFQATQPAGGYVYFNGYSATVVSWNNTQIVATVPANATTGPVKIYLNGPTSNQDVSFTMPNPVVSGLSPAFGPVGTQFQVNGSGFGATQGSSTVKVNGSTATVGSWSDTQIVATIPAGATTGQVQVTEGGVASSNNPSFTVGSVNISSVSPHGGAVGAQVTVTGSGFGGSQGTSTISFNGTTATAITSWSDMQIVATVPSGATSGAVKVVNGGVSSNTNVNFTIAGVVVNSVSPASGLAGSQFQINGTGFGATQGSSTVRVNGYTATVVSWTSTQITVNDAASAYASGSVVVTVGSTSSNNDVTFTVTPPIVNNISPTSGSVGTQVQINGSNFGATQGSSTVTFNNQAGTVTSWSNTQIVATVPSTAAAGAVLVTVAGAQSNSNVYFTVPLPHVASLSPASGVVGTQVTVAGSGFQSTRPAYGAVYFTSPSGALAASVSSWSDTQIVVTVPSGAFSGPVEVYTNVFSNNDVAFTMPIPTITSVSPATGAAGTQVQVNGQGFGATQGTSTVALSGASGYYNAGVVSWSDTQIVATVPAAATAGPVKVTEGGVSSNTNVYFAVPAPQISSVSPVSGTVGTQVTITGSGFQASQGSNTLYFSSGNSVVSPTINSWSDTQIVATTTSGVTTGPVKVYVNGVVSNQNVQFTVPNPVITGLAPSSGPVGTQVQINGVGFGATQGSSTVTFYFGVTAAVTSWSDTQIVATVPALGTSGAVKVTEGGVASNTNIDFTIPAPQITSLSPSSGVVGSQVTINGSGFQAGQGTGNVTFTNGNNAATITSWSDTQIVVTVPAGATTGAVKVLAANSVNSNQNVIFTLPNPVVTSLSPGRGPVGTQVQINGTGFGAAQGSSTVIFNGASSFPANIVSWSDTQILAIVPSPAVTGMVKVVEGGVASTNSVDFTVPAPQITSLTPNIGGVGNTVTIAGTGFQSSQCTPACSSATFTVVSWSDTQIVTTVPVGTTTGPVTVTVSGVASNPANYTIPNNVVNSLSPSSGPVGTQVTVSGAGFGATQGTSALTFSGQPPASISSWSNTQIVATVPVTAVTGPAAVTVSNVPSNVNVIFTVPPPNLTAYSPMGGVAGTAVTITGTGFQANQRNSAVTFNGTAGTVTSWSDTQIVVNVPTGATSGPMLVTVNSVSSNSGNKFIVPNPVITGVSPTEAPVGGRITITGSGFGPSNMATDIYGNSSLVSTVNVNGANSGAGLIASWSDTQIVMQVPGGAAASGNITVNPYDAVSNAVPFSVEGAPTITSLSPPAGPAGSSVTISGSGFGPAGSTSSVTFSGVTATVNSWSDRQIIVTVPSGVWSGPVSVSVAFVASAGLQYIVTVTRQTTDSLGNTSSYTSEDTGGGWYNIQATGSGCSSCTVRGNISNTFDPYGNQLTHTDELGHVTTYTYDSNFNLASVSQPLDSTTTVTTSYTNNSFGEPLTVTDALGNVTTNTYDGNGNLLSVTSPAPNGTTAASVTNFAYDTKGELTQITDPLNNITTLTYNPVGLIATIKDAQNNVTTYGYDTHGNRTSITDALNKQTTFTYDAADRLTKITYPDNTFVTFAYDSRGRRTSVTDQNGKITTYAYDDADRLTSVTDAANHLTSYAYDTENNLLSITDGNNHATSFTYDAFGRVTKTTFPSTLVESYLYDSAGNLTSKTDRKGNSILFVYDALNRLTHKGYPDSTGVDYVYDLVSKIKQVTDPTGTYAMAYDNMGRLIGTTTQYTFLPGKSFTNSYAYDAASNRTSLTLPDASNDTYAYDTLNRLKSITDSLTGQFNFGYDALSRRTSLTRPNGVNTSYGYDSLSRLLNVLHKSGTNTLDGASYTYDNAGNRTAKTNQLNSITEQYTYDPLYQLTKVAQGTTTTESYNYDSVGNRLSSLGVNSYSYNSSNELTANSTASFTYDNNGNTLAKGDSTGTRNYTWDFENRLSSVVLPGSGGTVTFKYDPFGRRIQKSSSSGTTNYLYDGANIIEELDANGNEVARYSQAGRVDEPLAETRSGATSFYEQDGLASITSLSSTTGAISNSYTYDTFGNLTASTGSIANPFQYTARDYDAETGLRYYRARYFDSSVGRFLSEDPARFFAGIDFYSYAGNAPPDFNDPSGLDYHVKYDPNTNTIIVSASVILYGPNATETVAAGFELYTNRMWNAGHWKYKKCNVKFDFKFIGEPNRTSILVPGSAEGDNYVYVTADPLTSYVMAGTWNWTAYGIWWAGMGEQDVAHEMGHFLGLGDDYGWLSFGNHKGHMMGNDIFRDVVQHEVDSVVSGRDLPQSCPCH